MVFDDIEFPEIREWRSKNKPTTLSESLSAIIESNGGEFEPDEKIIVESVVEMLKGGSDEINPKIYYADDLPN